jgi:hypothetical protein
MQIVTMAREAEHRGKPSMSVRRTVTCLRSASMTHFPARCLTSRYNGPRLWSDQWRDVKAEEQARERQRLSELREAPALEGVSAVERRDAGSVGSAPPC